MVDSTGSVGMMIVTACVILSLSLQQRHTDKQVKELEVAKAVPDTVYVHVVAVPDSLMGTVHLDSAIAPVDSVKVRE